MKSHACSVWGQFHILPHVLPQFCPIPGNISLDSFLMRIRICVQPMNMIVQAFLEVRKNTFTSNIHIFDYQIICVLAQYDTNNYV